MHADLSDVECNVVYNNAVVYCANEIGYGYVQRDDVSGFAARVLYIGQANGGNANECAAVCDDPSIALADPAYNCNAWTLNTEDPYNLYGIPRTCVLMHLFDLDYTLCALYQSAADAPDSERITSSVQLTDSNDPVCSQ